MSNIFEKIINDVKDNGSKLLNDIKQKSEAKRLQNEYYEEIKADSEVFGKLISNPEYERVERFVGELKKRLEIAMRYSLKTNDSYSAALYGAQLDLLDEITGQPDRLLKRLKELEVRK